MIQFDEHIFQMGWFNHQNQIDLIWSYQFHLDILDSWSCYVLFAARYHCGNSGNHHCTMDALRNGSKEWEPLGYLLSTSMLIWELLLLLLLLLQWIAEREVNLIKCPTFWFLWHVSCLHCNIHMTIVLRFFCMICQGLACIYVHINKDMLLCVQFGPFPIYLYV